MIAEDGGREMKERVMGEEGMEIRTERGIEGDERAGAVRIESVRVG